MSDVVRVKNSSYARYEELLLKRERIRKDGFQYQQAYIREFGELIIALFNEKMECIRKKKTIEYCQAALNRGQVIDTAKLRIFLDKELAAMKDQLGSMVEEYDSARSAESISERDLLKIKKLYRNLAKRMHPDLNPKTAESVELTDLWNRINVAYNCNDLKELEELNVLAQGALERLGADIPKMQIPDIDEKISSLEAEIKRLTEQDPYAYKFILDDPETTAEKKCSLKSEIQSYKDYSMQLDNVIKEMGIDPGDTGWRMN